jgi:hypothetical protein
VLGGGFGGWRRIWEDSVVVVVVVVVACLGRMGVKAEGMSMLVAVVGRMELERTGRTESERTDPAAVEPAEAGHTGFAYSGPVCTKEFGRTGSAVAGRVESARTGSACLGLACTKVGCIDLGTVDLECGCIGSAVGGCAA